MESLFLLKLLLGLVLLKGFLVLSGVVTNHLGISDQLSAELGLLLSHGLSELNLLSQVLLLELRAEGSIFVFLALLHRQVKGSHHLSLGHDEVLLVLLVASIVKVASFLQLVKFVLVYLEVGFDGGCLS